MNTRARTLWLAIGIPVAVILVLAIVAIVAISVVTSVRASSAGDISANATLGDAQSVAVNATNASIKFLPSADDQIHVTMTGTYNGPAPSLNARVHDAVAYIDIESSNRWLTRYDLALTVTLPASLDVTVEGINGSITLSDLAGDIRLDTVNGSIEATGMSGQLDLVTVNGRIMVQDAASDTVNAETVNGTVELAFSAAPSAVNASSTNGSITVLVPEADDGYAVDASTVLGDIDTGKIATDPSAARTITAETVAGSITVGTVGR